MHNAWKKLVDSLQVQNKQHGEQATIIALIAPSVG